MDIRKLQRAIVDGLEDVKGHDIAVFNTEHLSPLFERVIIASGTSNRQTKALAASVRDAVKASGHGVLRTEGEANGEWIIVDCGAAVVHLMQPSIREYYHLEEIWGDKPVKMKFDNSPRRLVKAESDTEAPPRKRKAPAKTTVAAAAKSFKPSKASASRPPAAEKSAARAPAGQSGRTGAKSVASKAVGAKTVGRTVPSRTAPAKTIKIGEPTAKRKPVTTARKTALRGPATGVVRTVGVKRPAAKAAPKAATKAVAKRAPRKT